MSINQSLIKSATSTKGGIHLLNVLKSGSMNSSPPNPPPAPRKKKLALRRGLNITPLRLSFDECDRKDDCEVEKRSDWRILANSGQVREMFLHFNPEDIGEIKDLYRLDQLRSWYVSALQPQNFFEKTYVELMLKAVDARLSLLIASS